MYEYDIIESWSLETKHETSKRALLNKGATPPASFIKTDNTGMSLTIHATPEKGLEWWLEMSISSLNPTNDV